MLHREIWDRGKLNRSSKEISGGFWVQELIVGVFSKKKSFGLGFELKVVEGLMTVVV